MEGVVSVSKIALLVLNADFRRVEGRWDDNFVQQC